MLSSLRFPCATLPKSVLRQLLIGTLPFGVLSSVGLFTSPIRAQEQANNGPTAIVATARGAVFVQRGGVGGLVPLVPSTQVRTGDVISTREGGKIALVFEDGSQIRLNQNTSLVLTSPREVRGGKRILARVLSGQIWASLRPNWAIETPFGIAGVRGTTFDLLVEARGATRLLVAEGEVDFFNQSGAVLVSENQQSVAEEGKAPSAPVVVDNPGLITEWTLDLERVFIEREINPAGLSPTLLRGYELLDAGRFEEAQTVFGGAKDAGEAGATLGLAWLALARDLPLEAQSLAESTAQNAPDGAAKLVQGLALLRQNKVALSRSVLEDLADDDSPYAYQGRAYLSQLLLEENDLAGALAQAKEAVKTKPDSALAQSNLAFALFYAGDSGEAADAARRAVQINPQSVGAQVALAQSELGSGNSLRASEVAARATALDDGSAQAFYVLGLADAANRDNVHALRALSRAVALAPDYAPAVAALARVYNRAGQNERAQTLLSGLAARSAPNFAVSSALGEAYYENAQYSEAISSFQQATTLNPGSALTFSGLNRAALDANRLNLAINSGQKAVRLAPSVAVFRSNLALAYERAGFDRQAEREYRAALSLDPKNALSLVRLGFLNQTGALQTSDRAASLAFAQGFLYDPTVSRDLLRGGKKLEIEGALGDKGYDAALAHRLDLADGRANLFGQAQHLDSETDRSQNDDEEFSLGREDWTLQADARTNVYVHGLYQRNRGALLGRENAAQSDRTDDRKNLQAREGILSVRHRADDRLELFGSFFASGSSDNRTNPGASRILIGPENGNPADLFDDFSLSGNFNLGVRELSSLQQKSEAKVPEVRLDYRLSDVARRAPRLTLGFARPQTKTRTVYVAPGLFDPGTGDVGADAFGSVRQDVSETLAYAQISQAASDQLSFSAQLRYYRSKTGAPRQSASGPTLLTNAGDTNNRLLPSLLVTYNPNSASTLRLFVNRRVTEVTPSLLAPQETLLSTERGIAPLGLPTPTQGEQALYELDYERLIGDGALLKLFAFHSAGRDQRFSISEFANPVGLPGDVNALSTSFTFDRIKKTGVGVRFEKQLSRDLFANLGALYNTSEASIQIPFAGANPFVLNDQTAPYTPRILANLGFNYIAPNGNKAELNFGYTGPFYQDAFGPGGSANRPRFGGKTVVDLRLAREPSASNELFFEVKNLFDADQIAFNDITFGGRRFRAGFIGRF